MTQSLPLHIIEELLRLDDAGRLSKVCKVYVNNYISLEYRAEPKVLVGGPCVLITYGYDSLNDVITTERTITTWTQACQDDVDAASAASPTGPPPPGSIATFHDHQTLVINDTTWTAIPNVSNRSTLIIQNNDSKNIIVNSDNAAPITEGIVIGIGEERQYEDLSPGVTLYLVSTNGNRTIDIEQLG